MKTVREKIFWGAVLVFILCAVYALLTLSGLSYKENQNQTPQANVTVIPGGQIPTLDFALLTSATPTSTADPAQPAGTGIQVGVYVQITGTEGSGLNVRTAPGTGAEAVFVANESEVFKVIGGPVEMDDYVWWQLVAPYDETRQGWAAQNYLHLINP